MALDADDYPFKDVSLGFLPDSIEAWVHDLTYKEVHSAGLGLVGLPLGFAYLTGFKMEAGMLTLAIVGVVFGLRKAPKDPPAALRVIVDEPWYFLTILVLALAAGGTLAGAA